MADGEMVRSTESSPNSPFILTSAGLDQPMTATSVKILFVGIIPDCGLQNTLRIVLRIS